MEKILIIDDEKDVQYSFRRILESDPYTILSADSGEEGLKIVQKSHPDLIVMDIRMGGMTGLETLQEIRKIDSKVLVIMMTAYGTTQTAIEAMKLGAFDYILKPFEVPVIKGLIAKALKVARDMKEVVSYQPLLQKEEYNQSIIGRSHAMQQVYKLIGQVSESDATVLITGESGTGKELVAKAIYHHSLRNQKPYISINCAAIPENLLESELFGHEKGAFTGATLQRIGKFEQCNGGTLFLDEIGDMPLQTQTKILRVLQESEITRVGSNETIKINVRILAASNKQLEQEVALKTFREDLFYRLNVVKIHLPPLRERPEDIPLLIEYFLQKLRKHYPNVKPQSVSKETILILTAHPWPGNIRELENCMHRATVISGGDTLLPQSLPTALLGTETRQTAPSEVQPPELNMAEALKVLFATARKDKTLGLLPAVERALIIAALAEEEGNQVRAAILLGITRATLRKRIDKFGIKKELNIS